jgi:ABC-type phosphate transport system substrate-binding protein
MMDENNVNHKIFVSTVLGTSTLQFNRMIRREMSSDSRGIFIADSPQSAINKISQTTGAIGYVNGLVYLNNSHLVERIEVRY